MLTDLADRDCPSVLVKCEGNSTRRWCIPEHWQCDGDNDCGNNWDERSELCGQLNY